LGWYFEDVGLYPRLPIDSHLRSGLINFTNKNSDSASPYLLDAFMYEDVGVIPVQDNIICT
jgi:hypothetical protein